MNSYDRIYNLLTEGRTTGGDVRATLSKLAHWRERARQNPHAKRGEPGYTRKVSPGNVNPDFPGEKAAQQKRGEKIIRKVIRGGEMLRAHRDTERAARGDRKGTAHKKIAPGVIRTHNPRVDRSVGKYGHGSEEDDAEATARDLRGEKWKANTPYPKSSELGPDGMGGKGWNPKKLVRKQPKSKYDSPEMGKDASGKFRYPKGQKQARVAARSGAEEGAKKARITGKQ